MLHILALNDDNHETSFTTEVGVAYNNVRDFVTMLSQPHLEPFEVRGFYLCDEFDGISGEDLDRYFDILTRRRGTEEEFVEAFEMIWPKGEEYWFY